MTMNIISEGKLSSGWEATKGAHNNFVPSGESLTYDNEPFKHYPIGLSATVVITAKEPAFHFITLHLGRNTKGSTVKFVLMLGSPGEKSYIYTMIGGVRSIACNTFSTEESVALTISEKLLTLVIDGHFLIECKINLDLRSKRPGTKLVLGGGLADALYSELSVSPGNILSTPIKAKIKAIHGAL